MVWSVARRLLLACLVVAEAQAGEILLFALLPFNLTQYESPKKEMPVFQ